MNIIFIDNLNATNIRLKDLLDKKIKEIIDINGKSMDLHKEFKRTLASFVYEELNKKRNNLINFSTI